MPDVGRHDHHANAKQSPHEMVHAHDLSLRPRALTPSLLQVTLVLQRALFRLFRNILVCNAEYLFGIRVIVGDSLRVLEQEISLMRDDDQATVLRHIASTAYAPTAPNHLPTQIKRSDAEIAAGYCFVIIQDESEFLVEGFGWIDVHFAGPRHDLLEGPCELWCAHPDADDADAMRFVLWVFFSIRCRQFDGRVSAREAKEVTDKQKNRRIDSVALPERWHTDFFAIDGDDFEILQFIADGTGGGGGRSCWRR